MKVFGKEEQGLLLYPDPFGKPSRLEETEVELDNITN